MEANKLHFMVIFFYVCDFLHFSCSLPGPMALLHYLVCYIPLSVVMVCLPIVYWKAYRKGILKGLN